MKIAIIAANGKVGQLLVEKGLDKNLDITAIARGENKSKAKQFLQKDLFYLTEEDIADFDVIVSAFGVWHETEYPLHVTAMRHLANLVANTNKRLIIVGGVGALYIDQDKTTRIVDDESFPKEFVPLVRYENKSFDELKTRNDVNWTYISPALDFSPLHEETGRYSISDDNFTLNEQGESKLSYADYASALIEEIIEQQHIKEIISVVGQ